MATLGSCTTGSLGGDKGTLVYSGYQFPVNADITQWCAYNARGSGTTPATIQVWRLNGANIELVSESSEETLVANQSNSFSTSISALSGDYLGIWLNNGDANTYLPLEFSGSTDVWRNLTQPHVTTISTGSKWTTGSHMGISVTYTESTGTNTKINIGDAWKDVDAVKINIGDTWKEVVGIQQNIGDAWKTVF